MTATATEDYAPGIHLGVDYYPMSGSLSVSSAKVLLKAPALYQWQRENPVHSEPFDFGKVVHALVLGAKTDQVYVAPFKDWRTNAAKEEREIARAEGLAPVLPHEFEQACEMADKVRDHETAAKLLTGGDSEVYVLAEDPETGIMRRAWVDYLTTTVAVDYKSAASVEPHAFATAAARYGYHQQAAWTLDMLADLGHDVEAFAFVTQEKEAPYLVEVYELDAEAIDRGRELNRRALERYRDCLATDIWPGYTGQPFTRLSLPRWAHYDQEGTA